MEAVSDRGARGRTNARLGGVLQPTQDRATISQASWAAPDRIVPRMPLCSELTNSLRRRLLTPLGASLYLAELGPGGMPTSVSRDVMLPLRRDVMLPPWIGRKVIPPSPRHG